MRSGAGGVLFANLKGRCEVLRAISKTVLCSVLPTERARNARRGRGAVLELRAGF